MTIIKSSAALFCTLALAATTLAPQVDAHAFLLLPKTEIITPNKNLYAYWIQGKKVPPENAYFTGNAERNAEGFKKNYKAGNWKSLKEMIFATQEVTGPYSGRPVGGTAECGFTVPTATPQPLPDMIEYGNYNLQNREGIHPGPCEAWCDDEIVIPFTEDCRKILFKPIPYAKDKCVGKSRFTFYWVATHFAPFQVYTSCAPLQGGGGGGNTSKTPAVAGGNNNGANKTPAAASKAPAASGNNNNNNNNNKTPAANNNNNNNKAPAGNNSKAPANNNKNNNNGKVASDSDATMPAKNGTDAAVKCKAKRT